MKPSIAIDTALLDRRLLGAALGDPATWSTWIDVLRVLFGGEPDDAGAFDKISGGRALPGKRMKELWAICGRRSGKSRMAAAIAVYVALFQRHKLSAGEQGCVLVLAATVAQAHIVFRYALAFIEQSPVLAQELVSMTAHEIRLRNGVVIAVHSSSFRTVRGRTLLACIFDEVAYWRDELSADPESARAEWDAQFRSDIAAFLDDDLIERAVDHDRPLELPPLPNCKYVAFADASGGRHDHYTVSIAHKQSDGRVILDVVRGQAPPFDPVNVTRTFATLVRQYGCREIVADNYAAEWTSRAWSNEGIRFERSKLSRSELYLEMIPAFTRELISLPNHPRLLKELRLLERRTSRIGRDVVDHGRNGSDDYANSCAGVAAIVSARPRGGCIAYSIAGLVPGSVGPNHAESDLYATRNDLGKVVLRHAKASSYFLSR
jgi:hypothetical protein